MNQLRIDNGVPDKELVVMVTQKEEMTVYATPTPTINAANFAAAATASASAGFAAPTSVSNMVNLDPNAPFGLFNSPPQQIQQRHSRSSSPHSTAAPTADPAAPQQIQKHHNSSSSATAAPAAPTAQQPHRNKASKRIRHQELVELKVTLLKDGRRRIRIAHD